MAEKYDDLQQWVGSDTLKIASGVLISNETQQVRRKKVNDYEGGNTC